MCKENEKRIIPYVAPKLANKIRHIDIGELIPIEGTLDSEILDEERGVGFYRNLQLFTVGKQGQLFLLDSVAKKE